MVTVAFFLISIIAAGFPTTRPLPKHIDQSVVENALSAEKDVDCQTDASLTGVFTGSFHIVLIIIKTLNKIRFYKYFLFAASTTWPVIVRRFTGEYF